MIRKLLTTTAIAALLATGAFAQDANPPASMDKPAEASNGITETAVAGPTVLSEGYVAVSSDQLASRIIGMGVYGSTANDAEHFGDINDLVVNAQGEIAAVIIGVGGFLGLGEKAVAVDFADLQWSKAEDGSDRLVLATSREALEAAPDFAWRQDTAAPDADAMPPAPANPEGTSAEPVVNPAGQAMDRSALTDFDELSVTADDLKGTAVYGLNDEQIGTIGDFVLGQDGKSVDAVIVDVGGFLGLGTKPVAIGFENLDFSVDANNNRYLFINASKEQLEAQPAFNRDTYAAERDAQRLLIGN